MSKGTELSEVAYCLIPNQSDLDLRPHVEFSIPIFAGISCFCRFEAVSYAMSRCIILLFSKQTICFFFTSFHSTENYFSLVHTNACQADLFVIRLSTTDEFLSDYTSLFQLQLTLVVAYRETVSDYNEAFVGSLNELSMV